MKQKKGRRGWSRPGVRSQRKTRQKGKIQLLDRRTSVQGFGTGPLHPKPRGSAETSPPAPLIKKMEGRSWKRGNTKSLEKGQAAAPKSPGIKTFADAVERSISPPDNSAPRGFGAGHVLFVPDYRCGKPHDCHSLATIQARHTPSLGLIRSKTKKTIVGGTGPRHETWCPPLTEERSLTTTLSRN